MSQSTINNIIELYNNNKSLAYIQKTLGVAPHTSKKYLIKNGIYIRDFKTQSNIGVKENRDKYRKHFINKNFFNEWSVDMAYILGWIITDGSISKNRLKIQIKFSDLYILEYIKKCFEYTGEIHLINNKFQDKTFPTAKLDVTCFEYIEKLKSFGIVENKTMTIKYPTNLPKEYELDFIRGVFDGDGFTKKGKYLRAGFCSGSYDFINELMLKLTEYGMSHRKIYKHKNSECYYIEYSSKELVLFYNLLYKNNPVCLTRKKEIFEQSLCF